MGSVKSTKTNVTTSYTPPKQTKKEAIKTKETESTGTKKAESTTAKASTKISVPKKTELDEFTKSDNTAKNKTTSGTTKNNTAKTDNNPFAKSSTSEKTTVNNADSETIKNDAIKIIKNSASKVSGSTTQNNTSEKTTKKIVSKAFDNAFDKTKASEVLNGAKSAIATIEDNVCKKEKAIDHVYTLKSVSLRKEEIAEYTEKIHDSLKASKNDKKAVYNDFKDGNLNPSDKMAIMKTYQYTYKKYMSDDILKYYPWSCRKEFVDEMSLACAQYEVNIGDGRGTIYLERDENLLKYSSHITVTPQGNPNIRVSTMYGGGVRG